MKYEVENIPHRYHHYKNAMSFWSKMFYLNYRGFQLTANQLDGRIL